MSFFHKTFWALRRVEISLKLSFDKNEKKEKKKREKAPVKELKRARGPSGTLGNLRSLNLDRVIKRGMVCYLLVLFSHFICFVYFFFVSCRKIDVSRV